MQMTLICLFIFTNIEEGVHPFGMESLFVPLHLHTNKKHKIIIAFA
jgi:hypothetical protein